MSSGHFEGKSVVEHLKAARSKGATAAIEIHGLELPGHMAAGCDAARETAVVLVLLWLLFIVNLLSLTPLLIFTASWLVWKVGRSAFLGYARLERLHRVIEEERWEIEHHREQEKEELTEMYRAKGLSGKLLEEVIDVLMADDNRLLRVMLEEELGLTLEAYEHPLKQSFGAGIGVLAASLLTILGYLISPLYGLPVGAVIIICIATFIAAKMEKNRVLPATIWALAIAFLSCGLTYFFLQLV